MIISIATEQCKVYTLSGVRDHGNFVNLSLEEFLAVLAKFNKPKAWIGEIITNNHSCGAFLMISGRGRVSQQGMFLGPFQT